MRYDFDTVIDRRHSDSTKWRHFPDDVISLWTADMDFRSPQPVVDALHERVEHGVFGYCPEFDALGDAVAERMERLHGWHITRRDILWQTGVVHALHAVCRAVVAQHDAVLYQTPVYPPIHTAPAHTDRVGVGALLTERPDGRYEIDFDRFEAAVTPATRLFILCNPHNPVGRVFERWELERLADACLRHNLLICSDEIHADLVFSGFAHTPIASLSQEVAARTITLIAPSKTFNLAGLRCSFAIVQDPGLRRAIRVGEGREFSEVNVLGQVAALAAYRAGQDWLDQLLRYLEANRDRVTSFVREELPGTGTTPVEATYLAWLDCRAAGIQGSPYEFFLERGRVGLQDGAWFGPGGEGFVRLNFGCPRAVLEEALMRMKRAFENPSR
ncbi:MAG: MalY/PatB family protein [Bacteroidales bacterium]